MRIWSFVREHTLVKDREFSIRWNRARWRLRLRCGCVVHRYAKLRGGVVSLPPMRCRCEAAPGCRRHVNTEPDGTGATVEASP